MEVREQDELSDLCDSMAQGYPVFPSCFLCFSVGPVFRSLSWWRGSGVATMHVYPEMRFQKLKRLKELHLRRLKVSPQRHQ